MEEKKVKRAKGNRKVIISGVLAGALLFASVSEINLTKNEIIYEGKELKKLSYFNTANLGEIKKDKIQRIYDLYNLMGLIEAPIDLEKFVFDLNNSTFAHKFH